MTETATGGSGATARRGRRRTVALALLVLALVVGSSVYLGAGYLAYDQLSAVQSHCGTASYPTQTPADFFITGTRVTPDVSAYHFSDYSDVSFPTRGGGLTIRPWYTPPRDPEGPIVIVVHGYDACWRAWNVLLPAGMLHKAGFGVLMPDLRNHGESDGDGGRWAGGAKEYLYVLGAWDWLVGQGVPSSRIGLFGASLGAATVTIATGEEPRVAATWADSSYADFATAATEYANRRAIPAGSPDPQSPSATSSATPLSARATRSMSSHIWQAVRSSSSTASRTRRSGRTTRSSSPRPRPGPGRRSSRGSSLVPSTPRRCSSCRPATRRAWSPSSAGRSDRPEPGPPGETALGAGQPSLTSGPSGGRRRVRFAGAPCDEGRSIGTLVVGGTSAPPTIVIRAMAGSATGGRRV